MIRPASYVGVSGVSSRSEAEAVLAAFPDCGRELMVGVLASAKTLTGQRNRWWRRYPPVERIAGIFLDDPRCLNLVHYASDTPPDVGTLLRIFDLAGPLCHGFQFNGSWPYRADLFRLHEAAARRGMTLRVVLQSKPDAVYAPRSFRLPSPGLYGGAITDVLIDASGGTGTSLKPYEVQRVRDEIRTRWATFPQALGIGFAGGLCAEMVPDVATLLASGLSCDAEGKLRDDADGGGNLLMDRVSAYLAAAAEAVSR